MIRSRAASVVALLFLAGSLRAEDVILKDGQVIKATKVVLKGGQAIVTRPDGGLLSVPVSEIDRDKTDAARTAASAPPSKATPVAGPIRSLAEAAAKKSDRKAMVVLSDGDVPQVLDFPSGGAKEPGEGKVELGAVSAARTATGYKITGSLSNVGTGEVSGVGVRIDGLAPDQTVQASTSGAAEKGTLGPGDKTTFTAEIRSETDISAFRYIPEWQIRMTVKPGTPGDNSGGGGAAAKPGSAAPPLPSSMAQNATGMPGESATPERKKDISPPTPVPRPDVAAPAANYPVGSPTTPGGLYVPATSKDGQPKPPGGN